MPRGHSIREAGLEKHLATLGHSYVFFCKIADANWNEEKHEFEGIATMARIMGVTDTTMAKWLTVYKSHKETQ